MVLPVGLRISDSGNSSKFEVSSMLLISIDIAAGLSLVCSQSTPSKKELFFISSTPGAPILCSHSQQNLKIRLRLILVHFIYGPRIKTLNPF